MIMQMMALLFIRAHQQLMGQFCCQSVCFLHRSVNDKSIGKGTFAPDKYAETNTHMHTHKLLQMRHYQAIAETFIT